MVLFKVYKGEKPNKLLKYDYKWLSRVDVFDEFEVWASDSKNIPKDRVITEEELEKLKEQIKEVR